VSGRIFGGHKVDAEHALEPRERGHVVGPVLGRMGTAEAADKFADMLLAIVQSWLPEPRGV
jgi:hypothetical protein